MVKVTDLEYAALALTLLAWLVVDCAALPVTKNRPWHNPCDSVLIGKPKRHGGTIKPVNAKTATELESQLKFALSHFRSQLNRADSMYGQIEGMHKQFNNLPKHTLDWYTQEVASEGHPMNVSKTLTTFHINLQRFLIGMEAMKENDDLLIEDDEMRNVFLTEVSANAKLLLCEVETTLNRTKLIKPYPEDEYVPCPSAVGKKDSVFVLGCEKSFFRLYEHFLQDWNEIFNKILKRRKNHTRKPKRENRNKNKTAAGNRKRNKRKEKS